jgi:FAD/FMN-containing dehydrogenase
MSKISQYLNEHILGEVTSSDAIRTAFSKDGSVLTIRPELVVFPRVTNDVRKAARFSWQLAEQGHILPITVRGSGSDQTGGAIGKGLIINTTAHLNDVIYLGMKDKARLVHVQPGITFKLLNDILKSHGSFVPSYPTSSLYSTVGGAVANNNAGPLSGRYGSTGEWVDRLEIVLANGDLIETSRINKRELSKKKGLQTFEGEIYRKIDGIIEDNQKLINDKIDPKVRDNSGYHGIAQVKRGDGSFDLTPLLIGSQGTLAIISEIVLKTEFYSKDQSILIGVFPSIEAAHDAADAVVRSAQPSLLEIFDGTFYEDAREKGKTYPFFQGDTDGDSVGALLYVGLNDFNAHARSKKLKRLSKNLAKLGATQLLSSEEHSIEELEAIRDVAASLLATDGKETPLVPLLDGASIAANRLEEFSNGVKELSAKHHVQLPLHIRALDGTIYTRPALDLEKVSDKQKLFKLLADYTELVFRCNGSILADGAEGRIKTAAVYAQLDEELFEVFSQIRSVFDPYGTLNPGVKQKNEIHTLVAQLRSGYDTANLANYSPSS